MRTLLAVLLAAAAAHAQSKPTVVDHALDVRSGLTAVQREKLQEDFRLLLARNKGILVPTRTGWKMATGALNRQDCDVRDDCLRQLAVTGGTLYALYAQVESNAAGTEAIASGRVVSTDGQAVRSIARTTAPVKGTFADAAKTALAALLDKLELDKLPPTLSSAAPAAATPPVAAAPAPAPATATEPLPPPPPPPEPEARVDSTRVMTERTGGNPAVRSVGIVCLAGAVVAGGVGLGFGISSAVTRGTLPADGRLVDAAQVDTQVQVNRDASVALGLGIGAGVLAVTSVILFVASAPTERPRVTFAPTKDGGAVVLSGRF